MIRKFLWLILVELVRKQKIFHNKKEMHYHHGLVEL
jgi:hypothetical protein